MQDKKTIWITGASSGIGEALALLWASAGVHLILSGRNRVHLEKVAGSCIAKGASVDIVPFDLASRPDIEKAVAKVLETITRIDVLVNNGGIGQRSTVAETSPEVAHKIMDTDFWGHVYLTSALLPFLVKTGKCKIVVMSSLSGLFGFPQRSFYCAAKHALHGYFETLRLENSKYNIDVLMVCPGRVRTNISLHALTNDGSEHGKMDKGQLNGVSAEYLAHRIDKALRRNKKQIIVGRSEVLMAYFKRYFPWLFYKIAVRIDPNS